MNYSRIRARQTVGEFLYRTILRRLPFASLSVLMYHAVTAEPLEDPAQESVSAALFAAQMAALRSLGVEVVPLEEGARRLASGASGGPTVSVVFDDGYAGVHDYALETLVRHRIPAILFLATESMGRSAFPWAQLSLGRPLTWNEVATLVRGAGCSVGSHTHTHPVLTVLSSSAIRNELRLSRAIIQQHVGVTPQVFAYPYGSYGTFDTRTRQILSEEGFSVACTTVWGRNRRSDDPLTVKRIRVSWCDTIHEIRKSLAGCYDWYRIVQRLQASRRVFLNRHIFQRPTGEQDSL